MKAKLFLILITIACVSCSKYDFWDVSKFKIEENVLSNNEEVKIVYSSQSPDKNTDLDYYIHLIVVSQKSKDTINVLTTYNNRFKQNDKYETFTFKNKNDIITKLLQSDLKNFEKLDLNNINNNQIKKISKVARDPDFDYIADNSFPSIIGFISKDGDTLNLN